MVILSIILAFVATSSAGNVEEGKKPSGGQFCGQADAADPGNATLNTSTYCFTTVR